MSIVRVGLSDSQKYAEGFDLIFSGKKRSSAKAVARSTGKGPAPKAAAAKPVAMKAAAKKSPAKKAAPAKKAVVKKK